MKLGPIDGVLAGWRDEAKLLRRRGSEGPACRVESMVEDMEEALESLCTEALTLQEAAEQSGLSSDHLGRLVREGKIPNAGRPRAPRIYRTDLPPKAASQVSPDHATPHLSNAQIVQSIIKKGV